MTVHVKLLDSRDRLAIYSASPAVPAHSLPSRFQHVLPPDLVAQRVELDSRVSLRFRMQRRPEFQTVSALKSLSRQTSRRSAPLLRVESLHGAISLSWHPSRGPLNGRMQAYSLSPGSRRLVGCRSSGGLGRLCYWSGVVDAPLIVPSEFPTLGGEDPLPPDCHDRSARDLRLAPVSRCTLAANGSAACMMARMPLGSRSVHPGCGRIWDRSTAPCEIPHR